MSENQKISAVIITFNEEDYIEQCILSLQQVVDEIVVVDSFSSDNTQAICLRHKVTFLQHKWEGYAITKNWGNEQASYDYILSIDADEIVSEPLAISINAIKNQLNSKTIYSLNRLNNYCGKWIKHAGWYPDKKVRLFPKSAVKWKGEVHEKLVFNASLIEVHLPGDLLHYSIKDKQDHIQREKKYASLSKPYPTILHASISALFKFIKMYLIKGGFLDGALGFQLCWISAKAKFWR